jgi:hypothetical protein
MQRESLDTVNKVQLGHNGQLEHNGAAWTQR